MPFRLALYLLFLINTLRCHIILTKHFWTLVFLYLNNILLEISLFENSTPQQLQRVQIFPRVILDQNLPNRVLEDLADHKLPNEQ